MERSTKDKWRSSGEQGRSHREIPQRGCVGVVNLTLKIGQAEAQLGREGADFADATMPSPWRIQEGCEVSISGSMWPNRYVRQGDHSEELCSSGNHAQGNHAKAQRSSGSYLHTWQHHKLEDVAAQTQSGRLEDYGEDSQEEHLSSTKQPYREREIYGSSAEEEAWSDFPKE